MLALQDCGLIVSKLTAESQVYGGVVGSLNFALFEDRILDRNTGQMVNPNMEWYLLAGMSDIPKIDVRLMDQPERGVIGIGEPPTVSTAAAIANAVRNAIGVTVRSLPLTPAKILQTLAQQPGIARRTAVKAFSYVNPTNEKDAVRALSPSSRRSMPLGGGQDLLARMKDYITAAGPRRQRQGSARRDGDADARRRAEDRRGDEDRGSRRARAGRASCIRRSSLAAIEVGTPQIRNQGTVGGNLNQRPRCWYFRNEEFVCFKKGGNQCFSPAGENQFHAIFGSGPSFIVHPSSLAVPSVAYGATFRLLGPKGERMVPAADYFTMPTLQNVATENVLAPDELLTHVILPAPGAVKSGHYEVRYKESHDWPIAFATVLLTMAGDTVRSARVVMGAVAPVPWRSQAAETALVGKPINEETAAAAAEAALRDARPLSQNAYKIQVAKTAVKRAILHAAGIKTV